MKNTDNHSHTSLSSETRPRGLKEDWPEPKKIATTLPGVKKLSSDMLPEPLRAWLLDTKFRMSCPVDFVSIPALIAVATVVGARCAIRPKKFDSWLVVPNLWGGVVASPGKLKSPALSAATSPISVLEQEAYLAYEQEMKIYINEEAIFQVKKEAIKYALREAIKRNGINKSSKAGLETPLKNKSVDELQNMLHEHELNRPKKPVWVRYKTNDTTFEKLHELMSENPAGVLLFCDELSGWLHKLNREEHQNDRTFALEGWNGTGKVTVDRIGRGTIVAESVCLSVCGGIQPDKLQHYLHQAIGQLQNDGLLQRFQLMVWPDDRPYKLKDRAPDTAAYLSVLNIFKKISEMDFTEYGATQGADDKIPFYRFSAKAQDFFNEWLIDLETRKLSSSEEAPTFLEHLSKYRSLMPSLALLFHLVEVADNGGSSMVPLWATEKAAEWCEYLESHARRIYSTVTNKREKAASELARRLKTGALKDGFTVRDVYHKEWRFLNSVESATEAVQYLVDVNWLREDRVPPAQGQKGKVGFLINPKIHRT